MSKVEKQIRNSNKIWNLINLLTKSFKIKRSIKILILSFFFLNFTIGSFPVAEPHNTLEIKNEKEIYVNSVYERTNYKLVKEVNDYIKRVAPKSKISSKLLVNICQKYDLDIIFVLAQGILESNLGTKGLASKTNSVWNVGSYDNGRILYRYNHPNESIEPYAKLLHEKYLMLGDSIEVNDKNILHLLQDRGYINYQGRRFATARRYEPCIRNIMIKIDMETKISLYQGILEMKEDEILAYLGPLEK